MSAGAVSRGGNVADKLPPQNLEAEMAVLGASMVDAEILETVVPMLRVEDFYAPVHGAIFAAIKTLYDAGRKCDRISLAETLGRERLEQVGGFAYLGSLMDTVQSAQSAEYYARIVQEKSTLRSLIHTGDALMRDAFEQVSDPTELAQRYASRIEAALTASTSLDPVGGGYIRDMLDERDHRVYKLPWEDLNKLCTIVPGDLIGISAAARVGKSGFVQGLVDWFARQYGDVAVFPLEIGERLSFLRHVAMYAGISVKRRLEQSLSDYAWKRWFEFEDEIARLPIHYFPNPDLLSIRDIRLRCRRLARQRKLHAIFVDHAREIRDFVLPDARVGSHERLYGIYAGLRQLARELDVPVFVVTHQNRDAKDGKPSIWNQKDGGNIEDVAATVLLLHRPHIDGDSDARREATVTVGKSRSGDAGEVAFEYVGWRHLWTPTSLEGRGWWEAPPPEQGLLT